MNLPNKLTTMRMILVPVFIIIYLCTGNGWISAAVFIAASFTDFLDGHLARKYNLVTNYGKIMDPLADKCLVMAALCWFVENGDMVGWVLAAVLLREFAVSGMRLVIAAAWSGKIKTVTQMIAIIFLLIGNWPFEAVGFPFATIMLWIAVIMTIYSGIEYIWKSRSLFTDM